MVFGGLRNLFHLIVGEPLAQGMAFAYYASRGEMVRFATLAEADVVHGGSGIDHRRGVHVHGACYDAAGVVAVVGGVEGVVLREHRLLHPCLEGSRHCVVAPPFVGNARAAVGHEHNAAEHEALLVEDMAHWVVVGVRVHAQVGIMLFGVGEGCRGYAVGAAQGCYTVYGGVGAVVDPSSVHYDIVGGFHARHHGEGAHRLSVHLGDERSVAGNVILHIFACRIAHPLCEVAVGAHHAARVVVHRENGLYVVGCRVAYLHG